MKKYILFPVLLCIVACTKNNPNNITANYDFEVIEPSSKAVLLQSNPLRFECEEGDVINIKVDVWGKDLDSYVGLIPNGVSAKSEYKCDLIYDGNDWKIFNDGSQLSNLTVEGQVGDIVRMRYTFSNQPIGDSASSFYVTHVKRVQLSPGNQTIVVDFSEAQSIAQ